MIIAFMLWLIFDLVLQFSLESVNTVGQSLKGNHGDIWWPCSSGIILYYHVRVVDAVNFPCALQISERKILDDFSVSLPPRKTK
jgi:hypothetical protein